MRAVVAAALLAGCSSAAFTPAPVPEADGGIDHQDVAPEPDAGVDATLEDAFGEPAPDRFDAGCATEPASAACHEVMAAFCARTVECCGASACTCDAWACSVESCTAHFAAAGPIYCDAPPYLAAASCVEEREHCVGAVPLIACSDILAGTANWPPACETFFATTEGR